MRRTGMGRRTARLSRIPREAAREPKPKGAPRGRGGTGQRKAGPAGEFSPATKLLVRKRSGRGDISEARCEACGVELGEKGGEVHHRAGRGSGGCRDEIVNGPANALLLCGAASLGTGCHGAATRFDAHLGMDEAGVWIKHGKTPAYDPRNVPVMLHGAGGGLVVYLAADGLGLDGTGYLYEQPAEVAA